MKSVSKSDFLFEVRDIFGKRVRTTQTYWEKIFLLKHKELKIETSEIVYILENPDEVRRSVQDPFIRLFYKKVKNRYIVVVVKYLNGNGFVVTIYKTSIYKRKGEKLWPK